jgi:hypothetical protein
MSTVEKKRYLSSCKGASNGVQMQQRPGPFGAEAFETLVAWGGIEPPTRGFSIRCSTN